MTQKTQEFLCIQKFFQTFKTAGLRKKSFFLLFIFLIV